MEKYSAASSVVKRFNEAEEKQCTDVKVAKGAKDVFKYYEDGNSNAVQIINEVR